MNKFVLPLVALLILEVVLFTGCSIHRYTSVTAKVLVLSGTPTPVDIFKFMNEKLAAPERLAQSNTALDEKQIDANRSHAEILRFVKDKLATDAGQLLTSPQVKQFIEEKYQGSVIPAF